jgi:hypothetical protein
MYSELPTGEPPNAVELDRLAEVPLMDNKNNSEIKKRRSRLWFFPNYCLTLFYAMPFSLRLVLAAALLGLSFLPYVFPITPGFPYGSQKVRGVNLGGWLVIEVCIFNHSHSFLFTRNVCAKPWITPGMFDNTGNNQIVDEVRCNIFVLFCRELTRRV